MNDFSRILDQIEFNKKEKLALATIFRIEGSSYRKEGAKMLFWEDGRRFGTISAGCLEEDLLIHALDSIKTGKSKIITYDLLDEDDVTWGVGCNGRIDIYIEPILNKSFLSQIKTQLYNHRKMISIKPIISDEVPITYLFNDKGKPFEANKEPENSTELRSIAQTFNESDLKQKIVHINEITYFIEKIEPKSPLYIFGAGEDTEPLVRFAASLDFAVIVVDPRESRCNRQFFPTAYRLIIEHPSSFFKKHKLIDFSFVVIMNHHFKRDKQILEQLNIHQSTAYIGILGSRKRTQKLLHSIKKPFPKKIYYPIGLNIEAEGPEEISISIMAELIKVRHQLRKKSQSDSLIN